MSSPNLHLEKTTQTDLLYGLALDQQSDVAVMERAADVAASGSFESVDAVLQQAATRDDLSHLKRDPASPAFEGQRWRYLDGGLPPERKSHLEPSLPTVIEPHNPWTLRRAVRAIVRGSSAWAISFAVHLLLVPVLALLYFTEVETKPAVTYRGVRIARPAPFDIANTENDITAPAHRDMHVPHPVSVEFALPETRFDRGAMPGLMAESFTISSVARSTGPVSDIIGMMAERGVGRAESGEGRAGAEFFGAKASGRKFVFVVDCSLSMLDDGRWLAAANELCSAIERLNDDQLFYVILFDGGVHRMFNHDERESALFPATAENKQRFRQWLTTARLGPDTFPFLAVRNAWALRPDAIYLLSDGDFKDSTQAFLRKFNRPYDHFGNPQHVVAVHTIAFHKRTGEPVMRRIAAENAGRYLFIPAK